MPDSGRCGGNEGEVVPPANITTTKANDRIPVTLSWECEAFCLDGSESDPAALADALTPYPSDRMEAYEMSSLAIL